MLIHSLALLSNEAGTIARQFLMSQHFDFRNLRIDRVLVADAIISESIISHLNIESLIHQFIF